MPAASMQEDRLPGYLIVQVLQLTCYEETGSISRYWRGAGLEVR